MAVVTHVMGHDSRDSRMNRRNGGAEVLGAEVTWMSPSGLRYGEHSPSPGAEMAAISPQA